MGHIFKFLLLFFILTSCSTASDSSIIKHDYSEIQDIQISYLDVFNQKEDEYYVYYYQTTCYYCHGIKSKIINYALNNPPFYFIGIVEDEGFLSHIKEETIGATDPLHAFSMMTPQLSLIKDRKVKETYIGVDEILNIIE